MSMLHIKHNLNPHLFQMWWLGMTTLENPTDHTIDLYPPIFHPIFCNQSQLGWKQLYYGQLSKEWTHFLSLNNSEIDATKFYAKLTQLVWEYMLEVWTARNQDNNAATEQFPPNMLSEIHGIYASRDRLPPQTQELIFKLTKEELMTKPKQYIQTWINNSKKFIRNEIRILTKQQKLNTQDIRLFFETR